MPQEDVVFPARRIEYLRDICDSVLLLDGGAHLLGQLARDLCGVDALDVGVQALPLCDPALGRVGQGDEPFKDLRRARVDGVRVALEVEVLFAVGAAFVSEALKEEKNKLCQPENMNRMDGKRSWTHCLCHDD
jgi:hypothetical protein